jgi:hypothetical protein
MGTLVFTFSSPNLQGYQYLLSFGPYLHTYTSAACAFLLCQVKQIGQFALDFLDQPGVFKELDQSTRSHCRTLSEEVGYSKEGSSRAGASRLLLTHA